MLDDIWACRCPRSDATIGQLQWSFVAGTVSNSPACMRRRYFREMLYGRRGDSVQENCKVNKHYKFPAPANVLRCILEYLYTGSILGVP